jgi:hypothetical protein
MTLIAARRDRFLSSANLGKVITIIADNAWGAQAMAGGRCPLDQGR